MLHRSRSGPLVSLKFDSASCPTTVAVAVVRPMNVAFVCLKLRLLVVQLASFLRFSFAKLIASLDATL